MSALKHKDYANNCNIDFKKSPLRKALIADVRYMMIDDDGRLPNLPFVIVIIPEQPHPFQQVTLLIGDVSLSRGHGERDLGRQRTCFSLVIENIETQERTCNVFQLKGLVELTLIKESVSISLRLSFRDCDRS